jgi:hypothetical protein
MAKKNYQVTIGYKSIVCVDLKAENEEEAKKMAVKIFSDERHKMFSKRNVTLQDDSFRADGVLNMDETWNML